MRCRQCGAEISENAKFCGVCGKKVEKEVVQPQQEEKKNVKVEKNQNTGKKCCSADYPMYLCCHYRIYHWTEKRNGIFG